MSDISKSIRLKRFAIKPSEIIELYIETEMGSKIKLKIKNLSMYGIGCEAPSDPSVVNELYMSDVIPNSKILWKMGEVGIGRLALKSRGDSQSKEDIGFSVIDSKVPIDSILSSAIDVENNFGSSFFDFELGNDKFSIANFIESNELNLDLFGRCRQFGIFLKDWQRSNKYAYNTVRLPSRGTRVVLDKRRTNGRTDYLIMGSNDYLGLASRPEVLEAAKRAIDQYGFGSTGSAVTTGLSNLHSELESLLAGLFKRDDAIVYNSGFLTNVGVLGALASHNDLVIADILSHASIQDGLKATRAMTRFFKHNDMNHLKKLLSDMRNDASGALVVTEGIFSMDGDSAPIKELFKISREYNARILVDEAHSFGILGERGLGLCDEAGLVDRVDLIMGSFSKICGAIGGFIVGDQAVIDWLRHFSRPYIFSVALPPSSVAAVIESLKIFKSEPALRGALKHNIEHFVRGLRDLGFELPENHRSPVIPVVIGDEKKLGQMNEILLESGIYVVPIVYPAVDRKQSRFRFTIMATHTTSELDLALTIIERAMKAVGFDPHKVASKGQNQNKVG